MQPKLKSLQRHW